MYFKLNPECYLVAGSTRATVQNLQTGGIFWLDEAQSAYLLQSESGVPLETPAEVHQTLAAKGWGFFSQEPVYVDKVRPINAFREKKLWKEAPVFNMAILQIINHCNRSCAGCGDSFCPICFVDDTAPGKPVLSTAKWQQVIKSVAAAGAGSVLFTGGECLLHPDLHHLIKCAIGEGLKVGVQTNGRISLDKLPAYVSVTVRLNTLEDFEQIATNIEMCRQLSFLCQDFSPDLLNGRLRSSWSARQVASAGPRISMSSLTPCDMDRFFVRKTRDSCLNGKMFICYDGSLVPCLQERKNVIGDVTREDFSALYKKLINDYWCAPFQDQAGKCSECEFVFVCGACKSLHVEQRCSYDPGIGQWSPLDVILCEEQG